MLIPKDAAFELAYRNCSDDEVASRYNVSIELARGLSKEKCVLNLL